jgi:hypothetical protein
MPSGPTCDYCRATIDVHSQNGVIVTVHSNVDADDWDGSPDLIVSGETRTLRYCNQEHLATAMERVALARIQPEPKPGWLSVAVLMVLSVAVLAAATYGFVELARDLF